jgi:dihydroorotase
MNEYDNCMNELTLSTPIDAHVHLREGAILAGTVAATARQFGAAIVMPNLKPPVSTVAAALAYRANILATLTAGTACKPAFTPYMCLYLTETTTADEVQRVAAEPSIVGFKLYPAGATTNSDAGVRDLLANCAPALAAMQRLAVPLLLHGEVTDPTVDLFDREAVFIDRVMLPLRRAYPALRVVFEHITTLQAAQYVADAPAGEPIAASITPQHLLYNRNAIFTGGLRPHYYCLPVLKREAHRVALVKAATSGNPRFFLGTDTAPHAQHLKEHACGCAGCYTGLHALELYATAFEAAGALDKLNAFASAHATAFYGVKAGFTKPAGTVTLRKANWTIPASVDVAGTAVVPLAAGDSLGWQMVG